ncbi:MAG: radical SAM protein [Myxococcales bacterium FL481]|nr:MAG: radical SAM protein [Myxococcales bacterium FL481]
MAPRWSAATPCPSSLNSGIATARRSYAVSTRTASRHTSRRTSGPTRFRRTSPRLACSWRGRMNRDGFEKLIYHHDKIVKIGRQAPQFPVHLTLSLGNYCNHACRWCTAAASQEKDVRHADADALLEFLERARPRGLAAVGYVGNGEPTAYPDFARVVVGARRLGLEQGMFTNGALLHRHLDAVLECFTYVRFSLDAGTTATHSAMHVVNDQFDRILDNIGRLVAGRRGGSPTVGIQFATHHENISDLPAAARLARELGVDYLNVKPVFNQGGGRDPARIAANEVTPEQLDRAVANIRRDFETRAFQIHYKPFQIHAVQRDENVLPYSRCVAGFFNLSVYEDGKVVACGPHHIEVGTIADSLADIEARVLELSNSIDLSQCPAACRYHALNHIVDTVLVPEHGREYHKNFL